MRRAQDHQQPTDLLTMKNQNRQRRSSASNCSKIWRCTGCNVTGTWDEWKSVAEPGKHLCDVCLLDGRMSAKLVQDSSEANAAMSENANRRRSKVTHALESDGCCIIPVTSAEIQTHEMMDDDGGCKVLANGCNATRTALVIAAEC